MPVGGDVTQFFLGLMGFLSESLRDGRLPVWNDLWGYGFPGLAESQMGVFYPPHALLYGHLETETAYVVSLVLHTLWGGLGTFWASRRIGISRIGSALAAFSWSACGFFVIHLAHRLGIYDRLLDALGLRPGLVDPRTRGADPPCGAACC